MAKPIKVHLTVDGAPPWVVAMLRERVADRVTVFFGPDEVQHFLRGVDTGQGLAGKKVSETTRNQVEARVTELVGQELVFSWEVAGKESN